MKRLMVTICAVLFVVVMIYVYVLKENKSVGVETTAVVEYRFVESRQWNFSNDGIVFDKPECRIRVVLTSGKTIDVIVDNVSYFEYNPGDVVTLICNNDKCEVKQ